MAKHTPYSAGDLIKSSYTNDDIDGLASGINDTDNNSMVKFRGESFDPFFVSGGAVWAVTSGLSASMSAGVLYVSGNRVPLSAIGTRAFTANRDTYIDFSSSGTVSYTEVSNGAAAPTLAAGRTRNAVIVTGASSITAIIQKDRDSLGNLVCNRKPVAKESSAPRVNLITTATSVTPDTTNHDVIAVTALASALTINMPAGSPANCQAILFRIKDNGTARGLTWNGVYRGIGVTIPNATVASKTLYVACRYNAQETKWDVLSVGRMA